MPFHWSQTLLEPSSVISPGTLGRALKHGGNRNGLAFREAVLEDVRQKHFSEAPSRLTSSFFFDDIPQAREYEKLNRLLRNNLYEVRLTNAIAPIFRADFRHVGSNLDLPLGFDWAIAYWIGRGPGGEERPGIFTECFAETGLEIVRQINSDDALLKSKPTLSTHRRRHTS